MKHTTEYLLLCENVIVGEQGKASLINLYDRIFADTLPVAAPAMYFAFSVSLTNDSENELPIQLELKILAPDGKPLDTNLQINALKLPHDAVSQKIGGAIAVQALTFSVYGDYRANFTINDSLIGTKVFAVSPPPGEIAK
ncbi:MAG TPA: hypothetical protein VMT30_06695 [Candidatus Saccharimonadia bacterium]|nr:hypothetical protein [Candidatus Saccharimonadia bacterium]